MELPSWRSGGGRHQEWREILESTQIKVRAAEARPLTARLKAPFTIATTQLRSVRNVGIRVELCDGSVGWGEAPTLFPVTAEDDVTALAKASHCCRMLQHLDASTSAYHLLKHHVGGLLHGHGSASVRAGVEMAVIDAVAQSVGRPLWKLFGGSTSTVTTDITIPICDPEEAAALARDYAERRFHTVKTKVGGRGLALDVAMLRAIRTNHPHCSLILDANEGYSSHEALRVLEELHDAGIAPVLFEQPVARDDWEGLALITERARQLYNLPVAADESCRSVEDAQRIVGDQQLASVINVKLAKLGVLGALEVISLARQHNVELMIGGMVETRLAMGFSGHLAAGFGCFRYVDLDTPLLLAEDPVAGGYQANGPVYTFSDAHGQGAHLKWS